ncbi:lymphocyte cytosolic protein 2 [Hoplias malabaricus]|uniref:lymphocyte cytosolic protein 2 n=1 Tax=Hoplias malabaricus TaxID=27720 RepID=UPI003462DC21
MNLGNIPSRSEVMGWNTERLADYLKRMRLSGCDTVVKKSGINGARFLDMSSIDLQKFPNVHVPLITKICNDINQSGKNKGFFQRLKPLPPPNPGFGRALGRETWESQEDEQDSDEDYEDPDINNPDDTYICAVSEDCPSDEEDGYDYELPPSDTASEIPSHFRIVKSKDNSDYIDSVRECPKIRPPERPDTLTRPATAKPQMLTPKAPRIDPSPHRPIKSVTKSKPSKEAPQIDRRTKPRTTNVSKPCSNITEARCHPTNTRLVSSQIESSSVGFSEQQNVLAQNFQNEQDMDPQWYVGAMKRGEAEACLRRINKDGTFLIRDSSKNFLDQPYTLMVLNKQKVYNIQIRFLGNKEGYSLGTGLSGTETFPSVRDMVTHHTKTQLLLIDAMDRGMGAQHECCLMHPAWC